MVLKQLLKNLLIANEKNLFMEDIFDYRVETLEEKFPDGQEALVFKIYEGEYDDDEKWYNDFSHINEYVFIDGKFISDGTYERLMDECDYDYSSSVLHSLKEQHFNSVSEIKDAIRIYVDKLFPNNGF